MNIIPPPPPLMDRRATCSPPPQKKIYTPIVSSFSWVLQLSHDKSKTMVMHNFGGYTRCIMVYVKVNRWTGLDVSRAGVLLTNRIKKISKTLMA